MFIGKLRLQVVETWWLTKQHLAKPGTKPHSERNAAVHAEAQHYAGKAKMLPAFIGSRKKRERQGVEAEKRRDAIFFDNWQKQRGAEQAGSEEGEPFVEQAATINARFSFESHVHC
jgi:transcription initiation factor TFIIIB Brf1 subunit/transcription initiation factor TFIIB